MHVERGPIVESQSLGEYGFAGQVLKVGSTSSRLSWMASSAFRKYLSRCILGLNVGIDVVALDVMGTALSIHIVCAVMLAFLRQSELEGAYVETCIEDKVFVAQGMRD